MQTTWIDLAVTLAALGAGLMAGVYFAFSGFIMRAFDQLGPDRATDAMNAINDVILRSWFMALFFGSTLLYTVLAVVALIDADLNGRWWLFAAGVIYVVGMFVCTAAFNGPRNNRLAENREDSEARNQMWQLYYHTWTRWNSVRAICSLLAMVFSIQTLTA